MVDFNKLPQRSFEVIPAGTVATLHLKVRPRRCRRGRLAAPFEGRQQRSARL